MTTILPSAWSAKVFVPLPGRPFSTACALLREVLTSARRVASRSACSFFLVVNELLKNTRLHDILLDCEGVGGAATWVDKSRVSPNDILTQGRCPIEPPLLNLQAKFRSPHCKRFSHHQPRSQPHSPLQIPMRETHQNNRFSSTQTNKDFSLLPKNPPPNPNTTPHHPHHPPPPSSSSTPQPPPSTPSTP